MNKREKIMAAIVAGLLLLLVIGFSVRRIQTTFRDRRNQLLALEKELRDKRRTLRLAIQDEARMQRYRRRALPSTLETARAVYQTWVLDCVSKVELVDPSVTAASPRSNRDIYTELSFTVNGQGDLRQLVELLYQFYDADHLHRIRRLHVKRIEGAKTLDLSLNIEALSLPTSENTDALSTAPSGRLTHKEIGIYLEGLTNRNLTGPPNNPPVLESLAAQTAQRHRPFSVTVKARDPDRMDRLTYRLESKGLPGVSLDDKSGEFQWTPKEVGDFEFAVAVADDGLPPRAATQTFKVTVADAPPPQVEPAERPSFDQAQFVFVTATTEVITPSGSQWQAWLHLRTEGKIVKLLAGERFKIGEVEVTVSRVTARAVELRADTLEKHWRVSLGQNLAQGTDLPAKDS